MNYKVCNMCGKILPATTDYFHKGDCKYGVRNSCKICTNKKKRKEKSSIEKQLDELNNNSDINYKQCSKCNKILSIDNFDKSKGGKFGVKSICKSCIVDINKSNWNKTKEKKRQKKETNKTNYKVCKTCGKILYICEDNFYKYKNKFQANCKDCVKKRKKEYRNTEENKKKEKEYRLKYYDENKNTLNEKKKEYRKNNPEKILNDHCKRRHKEKTLGSGISKEQWLECMNFFDWKCAYSGECFNESEDNKKKTLDHIIPLDKNGLNEIQNCVPMLKGYNSSKHNKDMIEWYKQQEFFSEDRLQKIYEWQEYAYKKWNK